MTKSETGGPGSSQHVIPASGLQASVSKRLAVFIVENTDAIVREWEDFARTLTPISHDMTPLALRDHIHPILEFIVSDMRSPQTAKEETVKSRGNKERKAVDTAAETHAAIRLSGGFDIGEMTSEYRALRASVIKLWRRTNPFMSEDDFADLMRFNEAIDQVLVESVNFFTKEVNHSKDLFVGILGHDLRSPVQSVLLSAELMLHAGSLSERQKMLTKGVLESADRIGTLIDNLLDVTRARFGSGLTIARIAMDFGFVGYQIIGEMQVVHPNRTILPQFAGDLSGEWDKARIGQVFSNLLGNAMQYGFKDTPILVNIQGDIEDVTLTVRNSGVPIRPDKIASIFDPLTRGLPGEFSRPGSFNLGLGLFITQQVVVAHGGKISVTSTEIDGTTFTARFPRARSVPNLHVI